MASLINSPQTFKEEYQLYRLLKKMEERETLSNFYDMEIRLYKKTKQQTDINMQGLQGNRSVSGGLLPADLHGSG